MPDVISFTHSGANYGVIHGGASDVARFFWSSTTTEVLEGDWSALEAIIGQVNYILSGHSGIPFIRLLRRGSWINVGVIGMPPNDGFPDMRFILLEQGDFTFHKPSYDFKAPVVNMQTASLTQGYNKSLVSGYWPSEDILPEELRRPFDSG
ncbi:MAG: hypothetical protein P8H90_04080 [Tateyamaria sp.]|nr:hypothetical protein [Tateyamaria sp.]